MICDVCKEREANVHIIKVVNGVKQELNVCEECAKKVNGFNMPTDAAFNSPFSFQNILSGIMDYMNQGTKQYTDTELVCKNCGNTYSDFKKRSLLGCSECYENFKTTLMPIVKRVQGNTEHVGKIPKRAGKDLLKKKEITTLKEKLQKCVASEEYEKAAEIRDMIKELQKRSE